jgi:glycosyltransferase involved in cell wall biosynthesis
MQRVSAVITTLNRPKEVQEAIASVLNQTYSDLELLVVVDGPDAPSLQSLDGITDPRIRVIVNPVNVGLAEARNVGVRHSSGEWIAFLDDDDVWYPTKIEMQVKMALSLRSDHVFVVTRYLERTGTMERVWPETLPESTLKLSEYMFLRRGQMLPSSYFVSRQLALEVPFTKGLRHIEDIDWLLRLAHNPKTVIGAVPDSLVIYNNFPVQGRESRNFPWRVFYEFARDNRELFTPQAFSLFIAKTVVPLAKSGGATWPELLELLWAAMSRGSMHPRVLFFFLASGFFSSEAKRKVRELLSPRARKARVSTNSTGEVFPS